MRKISWILLATLIGLIGAQVAWGQQTSLPNVPTSVGDVMNRIVGFITLIVFILAVFMFIYAGYTMVTSGGDAAKVEAAKSYLVYGAIGMGIALVAWALIRLIGGAFGVTW
ncbi:hypothetical protein H5T58_03145 [Candidatus Parcubacteria bacterium]|nr:hypothetical protein [Candidatus Parcubacteria bacterium]